ncbi:MAG TPA: PIN domain-containing protein [Thermoanaerobaculia bacterium]|nr:PIN domain-containing protein [Thermoanaerobaculia bacterium]
MIRTYVDSGVLIAAARGSGQLAARALDVIADTSTREFVCSDYVRLEIIPKPTYEGRSAEVRFYEEFFATVSLWLPFDAQHLRRALMEACNSGLNAMDAIHVVAAVEGKCQEIFTSERPGKPIHRTKLLPVLSIDTE